MTQPEKRPFDSLLAEPATLDSAGQEQQAAPAQTESQTRTRAQEQEAADQAKVKRTRIRQACDRCKSRKTKCNNQRPCAACIAAGTQCQDWRPGMEPVVTQLPISQSSLQHLSDELAAPPLSLNDIDSYAAPPESTAWPSVPNSERHRRPAYPYDSLITDERGVTEHVGASGGVAHLAYLAKSRPDIVEHTGDVAGSTVHWPISPVRYENAHESTLGTQSPYEMIESAGSWKVTIMLVRQFLDTTHVLWPTFHLPSFLSSLVSIKSDQDPVFIGLTVAIAFMSIRARRARRDLSEDTAIELYHLYWEIRKASPHRDWGSTTAIQALIFLAVGCLGGAGTYGISAGRSLVSEAVTKCLDLGLHRSHSLGSKPSEEIEADRRTLWLVYCVDKMVAVSGRPPLLRLKDIDQDEITISDLSCHERLAPEMPSLLAYHRTTIRLYMVLERILNKINMSSCSKSSVINVIARDSGTRRYRETSPHPSGCEADHRPVGFATELQLLDRYHYSDIPLPSRATEEDPMYKAHLTRIRTLSAFCRLLIASHLFGIDNNDLTDVRTPELRHAAEVLQWSQELLASQQSIVEKGGSADFGPMSVTQIAHVAKSLLPILHLLQSSSQQQQQQQLQQNPIPVAPYLETFHSAVQILRDLRPRFDSVVRDLGPIEDYARKLGVLLPEPTHPASNTPTTMSDAHLWTSAANVDPGLIDAVAATLPGEVSFDNEANLDIIARTIKSQEQGQQQQASGSGSGAIQALLSLSGRQKDEMSESNGAAEEQAASTSAEGLNASLWASLWSGAIEGEDKTISRV